MKKVEKREKDSGTTNGSKEWGEMIPAEAFKSHASRIKSIDDVGRGPVAISFTKENISKEKMGWRDKAIRRIGGKKVKKIIKVRHLTYLQPVS